MAALGTGSMWEDSPWAEPEQRMEPGWWIAPAAAIGILFWANVLSMIGNTI